MKRDIHGYKKRLISATKRIENSKNITEKNRKLILDFLDYCKIQDGKGLSTARIARYAYTMLKLAKWMKKDFDAATKKDIENLVRTTNDESNFKNWTKHLYKVSVKKFYKWLNGGEYPDTVRWIECNFTNSNKLLPEEILTPEEVKRIIEAAEHPPRQGFHFSSV